jgi:hypothetical protein
MTSGGIKSLLQGGSQSLHIGFVDFNDLRHGSLVYYLVVVVVE